MSAAQKKRDRHLFCNDRNRIEQMWGTYCGPWKKHGNIAGRQMDTQGFQPMMPGHLWFTNGDVYVGGFKDGEQSGQGTYYFSNGDRYVGGFKDGEKSGFGTIYYSSGGRYVGVWKDGYVDTRL